MAELRYRGREIREEDILSIRALIERYPGESRRKLSTRICEAWQWRQADGALRDMVCRGMLLMLERAGQITLPPVSYVRHNPLAQGARPEPVLIDKTPIEDPLRKLQPLDFEPVRRTAQEPLFNSLMEEHHYLGYEQPVGERVVFLASTVNVATIPGRLPFGTTTRATVGNRSSLCVVRLLLDRSSGAGKMFTYQDLDRTHEIEQPQCWSEFRRTVPCGGRDVDQGERHRAQDSVNECKPCDRQPRSYKGRSAAVTGRRRETYLLMVHRAPTGTESTNSPLQAYLLLEENLLTMVGP